MQDRKATIAGLAAIGLWAMLALLTVATAPVPPFQLAAICFAIAAGLGAFIGWQNGTLGELRTIPWKVIAFGTAGLFGYHALYFSALRLAPPAEAGLIAYLWPLLIVLFSGLLPGVRLRAAHVIGALAGFAGAALLVADKLGGFAGTALPGYGLALLCAFTWAGYSVLSRRLGKVPTSCVTLYCAATALLSLIAHSLLEQTAWPLSPLGWLAMLALGLGPVGLAFYLWDHAMKRGDIQLLGVASYAAPLISTAILVTAGMAEPNWRLGVAALLITGGALFAARAGRS